jgi:molybdenum cofactor synthesis domain-containing protein
VLDLDLLEKTTFWIDDVDLAGADLGSVADLAAAALGLAKGEVMVVDVRPGTVAFDVLRRTVPARSIVGKERELLCRLAELPEVKLGPAAAVHSEGVLGFISLDPVEGARAIEESAAVAAEVAERVAKRALVFASGPEVRDGKIRDTNSPYLVERLGAAGFRAERGGVLEDDRAAVAASLEDALSRGYGLVVTTGGVGAEDKDHLVEAILRLDPRALTPWILRFTPDMRRHHKEGVRVAVGRVGPTRLVALPGPHEEVRLACDVLLAALARAAGDHEIAEEIAGALRGRWQSKMKGEHIHHG